MSTNLTLVSTLGWFNEPSLSSEPVTIFSFGWYPQSTPSLLITVPFNIPTENLLINKVDQNIPTEILENFNVSKNIPIQNIGGSNVILGPKAPIESMAGLLISNNIAIEYLSPTLLLTTDKNIPLDVLSRISKLNSIPIEVFGERQIWILDRSNILWTIQDCGIIWTPDFYGDRWILDNDN